MPPQSRRRGRSLSSRPSRQSWLFRGVLLRLLCRPCAALQPAPEPEPARQPGWVECTAAAADPHSVRRAWRRAAAAAHPDAAGPGAVTDDGKFEDLLKLRGALQEPDRFQVRVP